MRGLTLFLCFILFSSCSNGLNNVKDILPRDSFLKVDKSIQVTICSPSQPDICVTRQIGATGSAVVVKNNKLGSFVLTAGHVCDNTEMNNLASKIKSIKYRFRVVDIKGRTYRTGDFSIERASDTCVMFVKGLKQPAAKLSSHSPEEGDRVYNLAAPMGIFDVYMIPTFEGFYSGRSDNKYIYSIPAKGGSSGSPIFNHEGEIVGMVSMAFTRFSHLSISPSRESIVKHVTKAILQYRVKSKNLTLLHKIILFFSSIKP